MGMNRYHVSGLLLVFKLREESLNGSRHIFVSLWSTFVDLIITRLMPLNTEDIKIVQCLEIACFLLSICLQTNFSKQSLIK